MQSDAAPEDTRLVRPGIRVYLSSALARHWYVISIALSIAGLIGLASAVAVPFASAIEIGGDEHFEVTKAMLWERGYPLYERVWNDQPPLHTAMLMILFQCFGADIIVARFLAAGFGILLLLGCFILVKERHGILAAYAATFCLLTAPGVLRLSIAAMLELPGIATALWALWPLQQWRKTGRNYWLAMSAVLAAIALQIKLTAAVLIPALGVEVLILTLGMCKGKWHKYAIGNLMFWATTMAIAFLSIGIAFGVDYIQALESHFSIDSLEASGAQQHVFSHRVLLGHKEAIWGAGVGLLGFAFRRDWHRLAFPIVLLFTAGIVHTLHQPYWGYYYLHFALPIAWLLGYGIAELYQFAWSKRNSLFSFPFFALGTVIVGSILITLLIADGVSRLTKEVQRIRALPRIENDPIVAKMKEHGESTKWVFAQATIYPFHARLSVIPELGVLPAKRFWSHQFSNRRVWEIVRKYEPEQILLRGLPSQMKDYLEKNYILVHQTEGDKPIRLYVSKRICNQ